MALIIEKEWTTKAGLRAVAAVVRNSHRVGYVEVAKGHRLHGKDYKWHLDKKYWDALESKSDVFKGSPIDILLASVDRNSNVGPALSYYLNVHGGVTYAGGGKYPIESDGWWFGFDCNHSGDSQIDPEARYSHEGIVRSLEYVEQECELLAEQIKDLDSAQGKPYSKEESK